MSFGYSVSDFLLICEKAKAIVDACRQGPGELQELSNEVWTLQKTVDQLSSDAQDPNSILNRRGSARRGDLEQIIDNCKTALAEIESFISKHTVVESASSSLRTNARRVWHNYQVGMADLDNSRNKLTFYTSTINVFLGSLNAAAMGRVMHRLDEIYSRIMEADRRSSTASINSFNSIISFATGEPNLSGWSFIQNELSGFGVSREDIEDNQGKIIEYVKKLVNQSISDDGGDNRSLAPSFASMSLSPPREMANIRQSFLANLDVHKMRTLAIGKTTVDLRIHSIQHGTYRQLAATMIIVDLWYHSDPAYRKSGFHIVASDVRATVLKSDKDGGDPTYLSPLILTSAPEVIRGWRHAWEESKKDPLWMAQCRTDDSHQWTELKIRGDPKYSSYLNRRCRFMLIVDQGKAPFRLALDVSISPAKASGAKDFLNKVTSTMSKASRQWFTISPGESVSSFDNIDLKEVLLPPEILRQPEADDTHEITLDVDRKSLVVPIVDRDDLPHLNPIRAAYGRRRRQQQQSDPIDHDLASAIRQDQQSRSQYPGGTTQWFQAP